jgi:nanoRNase/pAp phosphatase (c-di-AMP/oligoRNAs hydrolase)
MKTVESSASQIKELLQHSRTVLLVTKSAASRDGVAAALALAEAIRSFGRTVVLASPEELTEEQKTLSGADKFVNFVAPRSLVISLDYEPGSIDKIGYGPEGNRFNLRVTPAAGKSVSTENVHYAYSGVNYDLVFVLNSADLALLGNLYEAEKETWAQLPLVNIDHHPANTQYGKVNVLSQEVTSTCEIVYHLISAMKIPFPKESAELLLTGIKLATANFNEARPETFEVAAALARKIKGEERTESTEERLVNEPFRKDQYLKLGAKLLD